MIFIDYYFRPRPAPERVILIVVTRIIEQYRPSALPAPCVEVVLALSRRRLSYFREHLVRDLLPQLALLKHKRTTKPRRKNSPPSYPYPVHAASTTFSLPSLLQPHITILSFFFLFFHQHGFSVVKSISPNFFCINDVLYIDQSPQNAFSFPPKSLIQVHNPSIYDCEDLPVLHGRPNPSRPDNPSFQLQKSFPITPAYNHHQSRNWQSFNSICNRSINKFVNDFLFPRSNLPPQSFSILPGGPRHRHHKFDIPIYDSIE